MKIVWGQPRRGMLLVALLLSACATMGGRVGRPSDGTASTDSGKKAPEAAAPRDDAVPLPEGRFTEEARVVVGRPPKDFSALTTAGDVIRLSDFQGKKIVILQFWGIRCSPCLAEMGFLSELQRKYGEKVQVLGINADRVPVEGLRRAMEARRIVAAYPVIADSEFEICRNYTQWLIPLTVLVDRTQTVRAVRTGYSESLKGEILAELEQLISEGR